MSVRTILCTAVMTAFLAAPAAAGDKVTLEVGEKIILKAEKLFLTPRADLATSTAESA